jgi:hypothetical protein
MTEAPENNEIVLQCAGHTEGDEMYASPTVHLCGRIIDGISIRFSDKTGRWVISFADLERLYKAALKFRQEHPEVQSRLLSTYRRP